MPKPGIIRSTINVWLSVNLESFPLNFDAETKILDINQKSNRNQSRNFVDGFDIEECRMVCNYGFFIVSF